MRAAVYIRQSQDRTGDGLGIERQREDCLRLIEQRGWSLACEPFADNDVSAAGSKPRPAFERLLAAIAGGQLDAVVAWSLDRLTRNRRDQLRIVETCEPRGIVIALVRGSDIDMSTPAGRMTADLLASVARHEIEVKSDRQKRAQQQAAMQGRRAGGRRPFGYEPDGMTIRPHEAAAIRDAFSDVLAGVPLGAIARDWNARGLLTGKSRRSPGHEGEPAQWRHDTVRKVLMNPRYAGIRTYRREEVGPAVWPALVAEETYRATKALLSNPARHSGGTGHIGKQFLTGVALCGNADCGVTVHGAGGSRGQTVYRCRSQHMVTPRAAGSHTNRLAAPVDRYIDAVVVERLSRPDARDLLVDHERPDVPELRREATAVRSRLDALASEFADGELTASQLRVATERLRAKLVDLEAQIADAGRVDLLGPLVTAGDVAAAWEVLSLDRRRVIVDMLMTIRLHNVGRGTRTFRPDTVEITWRT